MPLTYQQVKERKESDPEYAERLKTYRKNYVEKNREKEKERQRLVKEKSRAKDRESYNAYMREWTRKNSESINAKRREKRQSNPELARLDNERRKLRRDPEQHRSTMLRATYGITLDDYKRMYSEQKGCCAICEQEKPPEGRAGLVVDHCHKSGSVRKLLCSQCNKGLGHFYENVDFLAKAIDYLVKHRKDKYGYC